MYAARGSSLAMKLVALSLDGGFAGGGGGGTPGSSKSKFRKSFTMAAVFDFRRSCFRPVPPLRDELFGVQLLVHGAGLRSDFASGLFCFQSFLDFIFFNNLTKPFEQPEYNVGYPK